MRVKKYFTQDEQKQIVQSIVEAERNTSGEIRVHIDMKSRKTAFDRAVQMFEKLNMHQTELRNGVLIYLCIKNKKFAIIGDKGINEKVPENFWDSTKDVMLERFKQDQLLEGLTQGIKLAGEQLKAFFPYQKDDINELSNEISFK